MNKTMRDALIAEIKIGLALGAGGKVIWAQRPSAALPGVKAPARPYATLEIVSSTCLHQSGRMEPGSDLKRYVAHYEALVTVGAFTDLDHDAREALERVQRHLFAWASRVVLRSHKIVVIGPAGAARDVSAFGDASWEGRAEVDLGVRWTLEWTADEGVIEATSFLVALDGSPVIVDVDLNA